MTYASISDIDETRNPTILTFVGCYLPGFKGGGPIRTVANLVDRLHDTFTFSIVTDDRDCGDDRPYEGVQLDQWVSVGNAQVCYLSRQGQTISGIARLIRRTPHHILYLNSLFSPKFTLLPLAARRLRLVPPRPTVLAPRGELGEGALGLKSLKKRLFLQIARLTGLYRDVFWQASSSHEAARIVELMRVPQNRVFVAPNLSGQPLGSGKNDPLSGGQRLTILFLSRITRMKNLDFAISVLAEVSAPVDFLIHGVIEDAGYWAECEKLIAAVPGHIRITYEGELPHGRVREALGRADLFILPTRGENYGHAIVEALGAGVPVLISDRTPWLDVQDRGAGWVLALNEVQAWAAVIDEWMVEPPAVRARRVQRAHDYAIGLASADDAVEANMQMFLAALAANDN